MVKVIFTLSLEKKKECMRSLISWRLCPTDSSEFIRSAIETLLVTKISKPFAMAFKELMNAGNISMENKVDGFSLITLSAS